MERKEPLRCFLDYTLITDETGQKNSHLSHQLAVGAEAGLGRLGGLGAQVWLDWCDVEHTADGVRGHDLQEADYRAYWRPPVEAAGVFLEIGWIAETFPNRTGDAAYTHEWYVSVGLDDSKWFGTESGVLNPYLAYYMDMDNYRGSWMEFGLSHSFFLARMGLAKTPILQHVSLTPSFLVGIDHRQVTRSTRVGTIQYGIDIRLDLSDLLKIPPKYGYLGLTGFLYFRDSLLEPHIEDRLYGGVSLTFTQ